MKEGEWERERRRELVEESWREGDEENDAVVDCDMMEFRKEERDPIKRY